MAVYIILDVLNRAFAARDHSLQSNLERSACWFREVAIDVITVLFAVSKNFKRKGFWIFRNALGYQTAFILVAVLGQLVKTTHYRKSKW